MAHLQCNFSSVIPVATGNTASQCVGVSGGDVVVWVLLVRKVRSVGVGPVVVWGHVLGQLFCIVVRESHLWAFYLILLFLLNLVVNGRLSDGNAIVVILGLTCKLTSGYIKWQWEMSNLTYHEFPSGGLWCWEKFSELAYQNRQLQSVPFHCLTV